MSAPNTNIDQEAKRHRPSLRGIAFALGAIVVLVAIFGIFGTPGWDSSVDQAAPEKASPAEG